MKQEQNLEKRLTAIEGWCQELHKYLKQQETKKELTEKRLVEFSNLEESWNAISNFKNDGWCASNIQQGKEGVFVEFERPFRKI